VQVLSSFLSNVLICRSMPRRYPRETIICRPTYHYRPRSLGRVPPLWLRSLSNYLISTGHCLYSPKMIEDIQAFRFPACPNSPSLLNSISALRWLATIVSLFRPMEDLRPAGKCSRCGSHCFIQIILTSNRYIPEGLLVWRIDWVALEPDLASPLIVLLNWKKLSGIIAGYYN
jgi:hypothetical protein